MKNEQYAHCSLIVPSAQQEPEEWKWCNGCKEYDQERHCCHQWRKVIRQTVEELKQSQNLIHCKDCVRVRHCGSNLKCPVSDTVVKDDDFCTLAERRDPADTHVIRTMLCTILMTSILYRQSAVISGRWMMRNEFAVALLDPETTAEETLELVNEACRMAAEALRHEAMMEDDGK